jgi:hypothetical protein
MTTQRKPLIESRDAPTTSTTIYTATGVTTTIDKFTATNNTASTVTISVNLCKDGDTPGDANQISKSVSIAAGLSYGFPEVVGHDLSMGGFIAAVASSAGVTIRASGRETTTG